MKQLTINVDRGGAVLFRMNDVLIPQLVIKRTHNSL